MANARAATAAHSTVTVDVTDELDIATIPALRQTVEERLARRPQTVVVDLSRCGFVGVDALGTLTDLTAKARRQGTTLMLVGLRSTVREVIRVLGLQDRLLHSPPEPRRTG